MKHQRIILPWLNNLSAEVEVIQNGKVMGNINGRFPLFSLIVANYNRSKNLSNIIDCIQAQDYAGSIEIIFVDDRSKDNSIDVLLENPNINIYRLAHNSGSEALPQNVGCYYAKGAYVGFIDSDDYLLTTDAISKMVDVLESNKNAILAVSNVVFQIESNELPDGMKWVLPGMEFAEEFDPFAINRKYKIFYEDNAKVFSIRRARDWSVFDLMVRGYHIGFRVMKTNSLKDLGGWPLELKKDDDFGMLLNISSYGYKNNIQTIIPVDIDTYVYRVDGGNASINEQEDESAMKLFVINKIKELGISYVELQSHAQMQINQNKESVISRWNLKSEDLI